MDGNGLTAQFEVSTFGFSNAGLSDLKFLLVLPKPVILPSLMKRCNRSSHDGK